MSATGDSADLGRADAANSAATPVLSLRGIRRSFGEREVLRGVDLDVAAHEVVALVGASGSGKSTLLRTVNLTESIDDGVILLAGEDVSDPRIDADRVRARIGVVFQHYNLFPHLSVLDNVTLASRLVHRVPRVEAERRARELLGAIGLGDLAGAYPDRLSGGQQQRVAIVRAIATSPELLLLDEVTSALDPELVGEVLEMAFARDVADRVVFLDAGSIIEEASAAEFFSAPREERTREFLARFLPDV
jgi:ABC-type polar amino acid transport system ATPase subunit